MHYILAMTRPDLPRRVEQTRALLLLQTYLTLLVLFFMAFLIRFLIPAGGASDGNRLNIILGVLVFLPIALWLSTRLFRPSWWPGWILAFVAELATLVTAIGSILGPFAGIAAVILFVLATYVIVNLFRAEVRQFFFGRPSLTSESPAVGAEQPRHRAGH
jgi:hypothetical protein